MPHLFVQTTQRATAHRTFAWSRETEIKPVVVIVNNVSLDQG